VEERRVALVVVVVDEMLVGEYGVLGASLGVLYQQPKPPNYRIKA
jgi:hypothetical protein